MLLHQEIWGCQAGPQLCAAGRAKPCQRQTLCWNKGDNICSVKSNGTENCFNPFITTAQSAMPQTTGGDSAGSEPGLSLGWTRSPGGRSPPCHTLPGWGDLLKGHCPNQPPCSSTPEGGYGHRAEHLEGGGCSSCCCGELRPGYSHCGSTRALSCACCRQLPAALAHLSRQSWLTCPGRAGSHRALWGHRCPPAPVVLNFSPCPCCGCRGRSPALPMCLSLQPTARPQDFSNK